MVAIAFPIFANALEEAQLRVNQANIRDVKSVATTEILRNWNKHADNAGSALFSAGVEHGWVAQAKVDKNGNISGLKIFVQGSAISAADEPNWSGVATTALSTTPAMLTPKADGTTGTLAATNGYLEKVGFGDGGSYNVQVYIKDIEYTAH